MSMNKTEAAREAISFEITPIAVPFRPAPAIGPGPSTAAAWAFRNRPPHPGHLDPHHDAPAWPATRRPPSARRRRRTRPPPGTLQCSAVTSAVTRAIANSRVSSPARMGCVAPVRRKPFRA